MAGEQGSLDGFGRPVIRLHFVAPTTTDVLALIDTGFNGDLYMHSADALPLGLAAIEQDDRAVVAGGVERNVGHVVVTVRWLGRDRRVRLTLDVAGTASAPEDPVVLIGTKLLMPHLLLIDFEAGTVEIERQ